MRFVIPSPLFQSSIRCVFSWRAWQPVKVWKNLENQSGQAMSILRTVLVPENNWKREFKVIGTVPLQIQPLLLHSAQTIRHLSAWKTISGHGVPCHSERIFQKSRGKHIYVFTCGCESFTFLTHAEWDLFCAPVHPGRWDSSFKLGCWNLVAVSNTEAILLFSGCIPPFVVVQPFTQCMNAKVHFWNVQEQSRKAGSGAQKKVTQKLLHSLFLFFSFVQCRRRTLFSVVYSVLHHDSRVRKNSCAVFWACKVSAGIFINKWLLFPYLGTRISISPRNACSVLTYLKQCNGIAFVLDCLRPGRPRNYTKQQTRRFSLNRTRRQVEQASFVKQ